jgi:DNA helicase-2/ATP-dependent DNA helicase PcrA
MSSHSPQTSSTLSSLNERQRAAVLHGDGPLLVLAGAGSGKTSTMTHRIAYLMAARGVPAGNILGLSFTNKAARELKERVQKIAAGQMGKQATRGLIISTFHSLCVRILRQHAERIGFQPNFSILDQSDQRDVLKDIFKRVNLDDRKFDLDRLLFEIGQAKGKFLQPEDAEKYFLESGRLPHDYSIAAAAAYTHYEEQLRALNSMDFDDLLFRAVQLLESQDDVREFYNKKFRYMLVDEYQDTNPAQFRLIRLLTQKTQNLCVVGDDDQSIYGWRGADSAHILEFKHQFPEAAIILLDQNYRSKMTILDAANHVIKNNAKRHPKSLWSERGDGEPISEIIVEDDRAEAQLVADEIWVRLKRENRPWKDFAVLYRSNAQSRAFEEAFRRAKIPYTIVGGSSFLERREIKDSLSLWRSLVNPDDEASLRRFLSWAGEGIGRTSLKALGDHAFAHKVSLYKAFADAPQVAPRAAVAVEEFRRRMEALRTALDATPPESQAMVDWAKSALETFHIRKAIDEDANDPVQANQKWDNVEELLHSLGALKEEELREEHPELTSQHWMREFLQRMALEAQDQQDKAERKEEREKQDPKNQVTLLTLHGAKGLEYPVVFLVGMEDGFLPHRRTIEGGEDISEERRLAYVGITRARDHLILTRAKSRVRFGKPVPRIRSRFLEEIPSKLLIIEDTSTSGGPDLSTQAAQDAHEVKVKNFLADIKSRLQQKS